MPSSATPPCDRPSSEAAITWFRLGDRDLATHLYRTARRAEGATLTEITAEIAAAWNVGVRVLPMTDDEVSTHLVLADGSELAFQDYFVRLHHDVEVGAVRIDTTEPPADSGRRGGDRRGRHRRHRPVQPARVDPAAARPARHRRRPRRGAATRVVAVSPIVGGKALKGPADRLLRELGHEPTVAGVARLYAPIAAALVIDPVDRELAGAVEAAGMRAVVTPSVMSTPEAAADLARATLAAANADSDPSGIVGQWGVAEGGEAVGEGRPRRPAEVDAGPHRRHAEAPQLTRPLGDERRRSGRRRSSPQGRAARSARRCRR